MNFIQQLKNSVLVAQLIEKHQTYSEKDRKIIVFLSGLALFLLVIFVLVIPAENFKEKSQNKYREKIHTYELIRANSGVFSAGKNVANSRDSGQSLLGLANSSSKSFGIDFKRYEPVGDNGLSLWMEGVSFNKLVMWLERLANKYSIHVTDIVIDRQTQNGVVNVRLELQG